MLAFSHFGFEGGTLVLLISIPGHCLSFTDFKGNRELEKSDVIQKRAIFSLDVISSIFNCISLLCIIINRVLMNGKSF